tara:strand:- start:2 stop:181 length:180 start_codon:yes stop_codon:yes gene_type:complete
MIRVEKEHRRRGLEPAISPNMEAIVRAWDFSWYAVKQSSVIYGRGIQLIRFSMMVWKEE